MFLFENHAFYVHEKHYVEGYRFLDIQTDDSGKTYYITWEDLLSVLETPIIKKIRLEDEAKKHYKKTQIGLRYQLVSMLEKSFEKAFEKFGKLAKKP